MRYRRAVEKLRLLADECQKFGGFPADEEPFLVSAYAFGDVLEGTDPLEAVQVVVVIRVPPEEAPWGCEPRGTAGLADLLRLSKGGYEYWWRSYLDPVWNHYIRSPVRIWSQDGPDTQTLDALTERRFSDLRRLEASPVDERLQARDELDIALRRLRQIHDSYWDYGWRRAHRGDGRYPEHELWDAVYGYLNLLDATSSAPIQEPRASADSALPRLM
jgi:hypothetical protein